MLICLRVKIGLSGFAGMVVAGALADELLVPACKSNWISKRVIVCQHWSPHSGHWGTYKSTQVDRIKDQSTIFYLLSQRNLPAPPSCVLPPLALERKVLNPGKGGPAGNSIWNTYKISINAFFENIETGTTYFSNKFPTWPRNSRRFFSLFISSLRLLAICSGVSTDSLNSRGGKEHKSYDPNSSKITKMRLNSTGWQELFTLKMADINVNQDRY